MLSSLGACSGLTGGVFCHGWDRCKVNLVRRLVHPQRCMLDFLRSDDMGLAWLHPQRLMRIGSRVFILVDSAGCEILNQLLEGCNMTGWHMDSRRCLLQSLLDVHDAYHDEISSGG
jgi:hypothetical protein